MNISRKLKGIVFLAIGIALLILPILLYRWWAMFLWVFPTFFFIAAHGYLTDEFFKEGKK